jgi:hypothetical protein
MGAMDRCGASRSGFKMFATARPIAPSCPALSLPAFGLAMAQRRGDFLQTYRLDDCVRPRP